MNAVTQNAHQYCYSNSVLNRSGLRTIFRTNSMRDIVKQKLHTLFYHAYQLRKYLNQYSQCLVTVTLVAQPLLPFLHSRNYTLPSLHGFTGGGRRAGGGHNKLFKTCNNICKTLSVIQNLVPSLRKHAAHPITNKRHLNMCHRHYLLAEHSRLATPWTIYNYLLICQYEKKNFNTVPCFCIGIQTE